MHIYISISAVHHKTHLKSADFFITECNMKDVFLSVCLTQAPGSQHTAVDSCLHSIIIDNFDELGEWKVWANWSFSCVAPGSRM